MFTHRSFNAEIAPLNIVEFLKDKLLRKAFAEEEPETPPVNEATPPQAGPTSSASVNDLIAKVRKEEKDKLYGQIRKAEADLRVTQENLNLALTRATTAETALADYKKAHPDQGANIEKLTKDLAESQRLLAEAQEKLKNVPDETALRATIEQEFKLKSYRDKALSDNKVLTFLQGEVTGTTEAEIDASIKKVIEKTKEMRKQFGLPEEDETPAPKKTLNPAGKRAPAPAPHSQNQGYEGYTLDDLKNLRPGTPEYLEMRKKLIPSANRPGGGR